MSKILGRRKHCATMRIHSGEVVIDQVESDINVMNHQVVNDADLSGPKCKWMNSVALDE